MFSETMPLVPASEISSWMELPARFFLFSALILAVIRLIKGPQQIDRIVALDLISGIIMALSMYHAIAEQQPVYLNVSFAIAVISFLGTIAFARYMERRALSIAIPDPVETKSF